MRDETDRAKLENFLRILGSEVRGEGRIYLTGGGTALLFGWRNSTIDVNLKAAPEPSGLFEAIATLKDRLNLNVELASPDDFIPMVPGWEERSIFIARHGRVDFFHYDPYSQALAKLERGHARDELDVNAMHSTGLIQKDILWSLFLEIESLLIRFPSIDPAGYRQRVETFCKP